MEAARVETQVEKTQVGRLEGELREATAKVGRLENQLKTALHDKGEQERRAESAEARLLEKNLESAMEQLDELRASGTYFESEVLYTQSCSDCNHVHSSDKGRTILVMSG